MEEEIGGCQRLVVGVGRMGEGGKGTNFQL